jgi:hypothetical protein
MLHKSRHGGQFDMSDAERCSAALTNGTAEQQISPLLVVYKDTVARHRLELDLNEISTLEAHALDDVDVSYLSDDHTRSAHQPPLSREWELVV